MNRRNFFKTVTGFVAGVCAAVVPGVKAKQNLRNFDAHLTLGDDFDERNLLHTEDEYLVALRNAQLRAAERMANPPIVVNPNDSWKFYVNNEEVDSNRAVDELGALHFPFQGAKKEDVCTIKSSTLQFKIQFKIV